MSSTPAVALGGALDPPGVSLGASLDHILQRLFALSEASHQTSRVDAPTRDRSEELVQVAHGGGLAGRLALESLFESHQAQLVRYLYYLLGDLADADDVAQEVLLRAYQTFGGFRGDASFWTWLRSIATHQAFNHTRAAATRERYHRRAEPSVLARGPLDALEARDAVLKVLSALPYAHREVLVLRYVEQLSVRELSQELEVGDSAAKMRVHRARQDFWARYRAVTGDEGPQLR